MSTMQLIFNKTENKLDFIRDGKVVHTLTSNCTEIVTPIDSFFSVEFVSLVNCEIYKNQESGLGYNVVDYNQVYFTFKDDVLYDVDCEVIEVC